MISTFLAGLAGILAAPVIGLDPGKFTLLIAAAFAAVIAARLRSLPVAVVVALLMGIAGSLVQYYLPPDSQVTANIVPSIPFAFVVISLIVNIIRSGRVNEEEGVGGALDRAITPNGGSRLAASTDSENIYPKLNFWFPVVVFAGICLLPLIFKPYWLGILATGVTLAVVFISYTLVTGEGGMLWLCQITFAGVGALATGQLATEHGWPVLAAVIGGGVIAAAIGVVIGLLTIRLGNLYVALVTLTFGLLMERLVFNLNDFSNFGSGVAVNRPEFAISDRAFTYMALAIFAVIAILIVNLRRSTTGLALNAVRWSENASRTMGLSVIQMKILVSGLAAFVAGVGGGLYAVGHKQAVPLDYATLAGLVWLAVLVTFGVRSNIAALLAGCVFALSPAFVQTYLQLSSTWAQLPILLFGLGAVFVAQNPEGTVHQQAMGLQQLIHRLSGARAVPAATAHAGRHDPRLHQGRNATGDRRPSSRRRRRSADGARSTDNHERSHGRSHRAGRRSRRGRNPGDRGAQRDRALRRAGRAERRQPRGPAGEHRRPRGPERRRQDHAVQRVLRVVAPAGGRRLPRRQEGHRRRAVEARASRSRPYVPAARVVHGSHRARARRARLPRAQPAPPALERPRHRGLAAPGVGRENAPASIT